MQVRYQAALRPEGADYNRGVLTPCCSGPSVQRRAALVCSRLTCERIDNFAQLALELGDVDFGAAVAALARVLGALRRLGPRRFAALRIHIVEPVARAADREAFFVQQLANSADEKHLVVLVVPAVAAPLDGLELGEFLL